jgi:hypothetical protein
MIESWWIYREERDQRKHIHTQAPWLLSHGVLPQTDSKEAINTCPPPSCTNRTKTTLLYSLSSVWQYVCEMSNWESSGTEPGRLNLYVWIKPRASHVSGKFFNLPELHVPTQMMCVFSQVRCQKCMIHRLTDLFLERPFMQAAIFFFPVPSCGLSTVLMRKKALVSLPFKRTAVLWS